MKSSACVFVLVLSLPAQSLVKDIGTAPAPDTSTSFGPAVIDGKRVFFGASSRSLDSEPWIVDDQGARRIFDVRPGRLGSSTTFLVAHAGHAYFQANRGKGPELWRTDGTATGTRAIAALRVRAAVSALGAVHLLVENAISGNSELWRSDGTTTGTLLVAGLGGNYGATTASLHAVGGRIVGLLDRKVVLGSDGTAAGTLLITTLTETQSAPDETCAPVVFQGALYFPAGTAATGVELARSDGTLAGTTVVHDLEPGSVTSDVRGLAVLGNQLFFHTFQTAGRRLWVTDGTPTGVVALPATGVSGPLRASAQGVLFAAQDQAGVELWVSDGTPIGTKRLVDLNAAGSSAPRPLASFLGKVLFSADDGVHGVEPYVSDGTVRGTQLLRDLRPGAVGSGPAVVAVTDTRVYFAADDGTLGRELWSTDGTSSGTGLVADLTPALSAGALISQFRANDGDACFVAYDDRSAIWKTDGTPAGTLRIVTGGATRFASIPVLARLRDRLVFRGAQFSPVSEMVYGSDGTDAGTVPLTPAVLPFVLPAQDMVEFGGKLWFAWTDASAGTELWSTDGTPAGTGRFADLMPGAASAAPIGLTVLGDRLAFFTDRAGSGCALWTTDGTLAGTTKVVDLAMPLQSIPVAEPVSNLLVFTAGPMYRSDGSAAGTFVLDGVSPLGAVTCKGQIFYAKEPLTGPELWVSDGTVAGCRRVATLGAGSAFRSIVAITPGAEGVFVSTYEQGGKCSLWSSDGTPGGTVRVASLQSESAFLGNLKTVTANERAFFGAVDPVLGPGLYVSDGAVGGTRRLADFVAPPTPLGRVGRNLLFLADDGVHGEELFAIDLGLVGGAVVGTLGGPCGASLRAVGAPTLGNAAFGLEVSRAPKNAPMVWLISAQRQDTPLAGCTLRVGAPLLGISGVTDALGSAVAPLAVPQDPALLGGEAFVQAALANGAGLALTEGLRLLIGG